jgi:hypothetical protein
MTLADFNKLKVGDGVYVTDRSGRTMGSEVLKIDKLFKKISVLCKAGGRFVSYRSVARKTTRPVSCFVGTCKY